jgi:hypothetical protein
MSSYRSYRRWLQISEDRQAITTQTSNRRVADISNFFLKITAEELLFSLQ